MLSTMPALSQKMWQKARAAFFDDFVKILPPLLISRLVLIVIGLVAVAFEPNPLFPEKEMVARGYAYSENPLIDMWARHDSGWYYTIVKYGYYMRGDTETTQSNIAFFPLYPFLVKLVSSIKPNAGVNFILFCGIALSNLFAAVSLTLLTKLIRQMGFDDATADRSAWYLAFFPTSLFLSSFYTESLYLMLSVGMFLAAARDKWWLAGACGFLLALTRSNVVTAAVAVAVLYMEKRNWDFRKIRWDVLWIGLMPLGLVLFLAGLMPITGDFWATVQIHDAWSHQFMWPWETFLNPIGPVPVNTPINQGLTLIFLALALVALTRLPHKAYGVYCLLSIFMFLSTGIFYSTARYLMVLFPAFIILSLWGKNRMVDRTVLAVSAVLMAVMMVSWVRFYWLAI